MRATFPDVQPGHKITDAEARDAAIAVRQWYEQGEQGRIDTAQIVTVVRWAIHRTGRGTTEASTGPAAGASEQDQKEQQ